VPYLSAEQMIEVDRAMVEDFGIELLQMMENAGRNLAHLARVRFLDGDPRGKRVAVMAGPGSNGGGALVCARWLLGWGARVRVFITRPDERFAPVPAHQLRILRRLQADVSTSADLDRDLDLILDGIFGYSLRGAPKGMAGELIHRANAWDAPRLALDVPSGVDATSGEVLEPALRATATMTLALPKKGLRAPGAAAHIGELYLADIGVPPSLYAVPALGLRVGPIFSGGDILRLGQHGRPESNPED
jgi:NAD(P)H-hydrate epimerase